MVLFLGNGMNFYRREDREGEFFYALSPCLLLVLCGKNLTIRFKDQISQRAKLNSRLSQTRDQEDRKSKRECSNAGKGDSLAELTEPSIQDRVL